MPNPFYKPEYECIIIGSALAGMATALKLTKHGFKNILILERQNMPGGVTTSFVRGGFEMEASLHEISSVSSEKYPLGVRKFLEGFGVNVSWVRIQEAFKYEEEGFSCVIHAGEGGDYHVPAKDIADAVGDEDGSLYQKILLFFSDCFNVYSSIMSLSDGNFLDMELIQSHIGLLRSFSYSTKEVMDVYGLPEIVKRILLAYWVYLGNTPDDLPYVLYTCLIIDYLAYGPYTCSLTSHELSLKMYEACIAHGIQIELNQEVEKILVEKGHVIGVKLTNGTVIYSNYVVSGAYPETVYNHMIEPGSEVPQKAIQFTNSKQISMSPFSVILALDSSKEELGLNDYMTFYAPKGLDFPLIVENYHKTHDYLYMMNVCFNVIRPECSRKGTTIYSITALPYADAWKDVTVENYDEWKHTTARELIELESKRLGFSLFDHILEIEYITPVSIAHYSKSFLGCIYGYVPTMDDNVVARTLTHKDEFFLHGLAFAGAHQMSGDGMGTQIINGNQAAEDIYAQFVSDVPSPLVSIIDPKKKKKTNKKKVNR
jgi:phytoene dehydrogenase-like protein